MSAPIPTDEGISTSFWHWAYNNRPGSLLAVLTDVGVQRFQSTTVLHSFTTLRETPMWRDGFRDQLPHPVVDLVNNYRQHLTNAETHAPITDPTIDPNTQPPEPPFHPILPPGRGLYRLFPPTSLPRNTILPKLLTSHHFYSIPSLPLRRPNPTSHRRSPTISN